MIRRLIAGDCAIFRAIRLEALQTAPEAFASRYEDWAALDDAEWERRLLTNPTFVSFVDADPVGIMGMMRQAPSKMQHRASLIMVYVRDTARGGGHAEALLAEIQKHAVKTGISQLELDVAEDNTRAVRFYERMGFTKMGRIPNACRDGATYRHDIFMVRPLDT